MKKIILGLSVLFLCQVSFADMCPSIKDIKAQSLSGWKAFDSEDGTPLSQKRMDEFKAQVEQFALAEWANESTTSSTIHCYYRDKNGSDLDAYFAKPNLSPDQTKKFWYEVSGSMHCAAGQEQCAFQANDASQAHLANR